VTSLSVTKGKFWTDSFSSSLTMTRTPFFGPAFFSIFAEKEDAGTFFRPCGELCKGQVLIVLTSPGTRNGLES